jgi:hypothetical protein
VGYYMRFVVADERPVALADVHAVLSKISPDYELEGEGMDATVMFRGQRVGHLTLNVPGDGLFDAERAELIAFADAVNGNGKSRVIDVLQKARQIVAVQVLFGDGDPERTLAALDPLWHWLHTSRSGLLQADHEGYYDGKELILALP